MSSLSDSFNYNFSGPLIKSLEDELKRKYNSFLNSIDRAKTYYDNLKITVPGILDKENESKNFTVEAVNELNSNLGVMLVALNEGNINFGNLGNVAFGLNLAGFEINPNTGETKSMPLEMTKELINWLKSAILKTTNQKYLDSIIYLGKLMDSVQKDLIESILILIDSIEETGTEPSITKEVIVEKLKEVGLSFNEDPYLSLFDKDAPILLIEKSLVTAKLYSAVEKKILFISGYDPSVFNFPTNDIYIN